MQSIVLTGLRTPCVFYQGSNWRPLDSQWALDFCLLVISDSNRDRVEERNSGHLGNFICSIIRSQVVRNFRSGYIGRLKNSDDIWEWIFFLDHAHVSRKKQENIIVCETVVEDFDTLVLGRSLSLPGGNEDLKKTLASRLSSYSFVIFNEMVMDRESVAPTSTRRQFRLQ